MQFIYVAFGGAFGAVLRYFISITFPPLGLQRFPLATLSVNALGSLCAGFFLRQVILNDPNKNLPMTLFLLTGVLGGFTTFSAFSIETIELLDKSSGLAALNIALNLGLSLLAAYAGFKVAHFVY